MGQHNMWLTSEEELEVAGICRDKKCTASQAIRLVLGKKNLEGLVFTKNVLNPGLNASNGGSSVSENSSSEAEAGVESNSNQISKNILNTRENSTSSTNSDGKQSNRSVRKYVTLQGA